MEVPGQQLQELVHHDSFPFQSAGVSLLADHPDILLFLFADHSRHMEHALRLGAKRLRIGVADIQSYQQLFHKASSPPIVSLLIEVRTALLPERSF